MYKLTLIYVKTSYISILLNSNTCYNNIELNSFCISASRLLVDTVSVCTYKRKYTTTTFHEHVNYHIHSDVDNLAKVLFWQLELLPLVYFNILNYFEYWNNWTEMNMSVEMLSS